MAKKKKVAKAKGVSCKVYTKTHKTKKAAEGHKARIKARGGKAKIKGTKITYSF